MDHPGLTRRDALKIGAAAATALAIPLSVNLSADQASQLPASKIPRPYTVPFTTPSVLHSTGTLDGRPLYVLTQRPFQTQVLPGVTSTLWGYNGQFPGPTIRVRQNVPVAVRQINKLPPRHPTLGYEPATSTHLHGSPSLPQYDGYANDLTRPGQFKDYLYDNDEDDRTLWYHDHAVHHTASNVYMGLAAQYHLISAFDAQLPQGKYDVPLIVNDVAFAADGSLLFDDHSESSLMGDVILVNGHPWPLMKVERRLYRFRLLNASISRSYRLRLSTGGPITAFGTDGGFLAKPTPVQELKIGMAERYEFAIDFSDYKIGQRIELRNLQLPNDIPFANTDKVMAFQVAAEATSTANNTLPATFPVGPAMKLTPADSTKTRKLVFERQNGEWTINGLTWADVEASGFTKVIANPALNAVETWELQNKAGGWFHPIHIHLIDFQILDRNGEPPAPYERGPKDVTYLGENETIRLIGRFGPHNGKYMIHCHNTVHEDHDMMFQMQVGDGGPDPITAAPPRPLPPP
ncbi:MAG TPA: multicopper oxidase domain-containing protein [Blastococcus sp.]